MRKFKIITNLCGQYTRRNAADGIYNCMSSIRYGYVSEKQMYRTMLTTYNSNYKKPSKDMVEAEISILSSILSSQAKQPIDGERASAMEGQSVQQYKETIEYFSQLRHLKLFSEQAIKMIHSHFLSIWKHVDRIDQLKMACIMVEQARYQLYELYQNQNHTQKENKDAALEDILSRYCKCIITTNISALVTTDISNNQHTFMKGNYKRWIKQYQLLAKVDKILQLKNSNKSMSQINQNINSGSYVNTKHKGRSNLQVQVQALLITLGYPFTRQVSIFGFKVDFVVHAQADKDRAAKLQTKGTKKKQVIVQVMGAYHYTVQSKLFGKDILRMLILELYAPVVAIDHNQFNSIKGLQNRLGFLQNHLDNAFHKKHKTL